MKVSVGRDSETCDSLKIMIVLDLVQHCFIGVDHVHAGANNLPSFVLYTLSACCYLMM